MTSVVILPTCTFDFMCYPITRYVCFAHTRHTVPNVIVWRHCDVQSFYRNTRLISFAIFHCRKRKVALQPATLSHAMLQCMCTPCLWGKYNLNPNPGTPLRRGGSHHGFRNRIIILGFFNKQVQSQPKPRYPTA